MKNFTYAAVLCVLWIMLSGCGFQLKGTQTHAHSGSGSLHGRAVQLASGQPHSALTTALSQQLSNAGALLDAGDSEALLLKLGAETFKQRNLSLTAQARSAEVELTLSTRITLTQGNRTLVETTSVSVIEQFYNDPRNVVGKTEELQLLRTEMRTELAAQIVRRIEFSLGN